MTEDLQRQLEILDNSQRLVFISLLGILLQYKSIDAQRDTLLSNALCADSVQPACLPDPKTDAFRRFSSHYPSPARLPGADRGIEPAGRGRRSRS